MASYQYIYVMKGLNKTFPGGKQDEDDRDLLHTAVREMEEEVGVAAKHFECLGPLDQRITRTQIRMTPFLGILPAPAPTPSMACPGPVTWR